MKSGASKLWVNRVQHVQPHLDVDHPAVVLEV
jgi:hypothetical protein